ncbi:MAG: type IV toxin-antitoxin system AbiEi family antitoxin [Thermodesulfobacteriota bacterium]|nr:type IV toxin-antitoxin system AbiEi family antitoxin [Thermodesulfobacteriota bacterium]
MQTKQTEMEILRNALEAFEKATNLTAQVEHLEPTFEHGAPTAGDSADALIRIVWQDMEWHYAAQVKYTLTPGNLGAVVQQVRNFPEKRLLVTRHVTPPMADRLRKAQLPFIDTAGNAYIDEPPLLIFIKGNKPAVPYPTERLARLFQPTGLQLAFALLCNPGLENAPLRDIAKVAKVALGTVGWVMGDLRQMGYLIDMGKRGRRLTRKKDLLTRWVTAYPDKLRPKLLIGRYRAAHYEWWKDARLEEFNAHWGGEVAAALLTGHLKPQTVTIYTNEPMGKFLLTYRLKKDPKGDIELLKAFWNPEDHPTYGAWWRHGDLVHPLLIYAELLATGDQRNMETAEMIYERELPRFIRED